MELNPNLQSMTLPDEGAPDLECSICFSQFNNVFRTPKKLQCQHTFCLECLARMNIKSSQPNTVQCPFCRAFTPLPELGLPKLDNDPTVLSCLPETMQRVYSIRFIRSKGRLQVKRPKEVSMLPQPLTVSHSLSVMDVGPPVSSRTAVRQQSTVLGRLVSMSACRAFILVSVVFLMVTFTCIIVLLKKKP